MVSLVEQLAQHIDREIARDLKVCQMILEISQELYVSMNSRKKLIDEFKEKVSLMVDMSSIRFLEGLQYQEMNIRVDTLKHVKELKSEALKKRTKVSRPIKAFTVYPPNTPAVLVPNVLPTKSQVKILIFTLIQLFSEFDQTCKKRITPSAITDGEMGFEQTKACYLQEVIPFFKTLKDNFEGIQKALTKEVKEMKDVFEELEAEIAQHAVVRKHDAIELKNLLIANDNLIAECLSQEVFCVATNSELNAARFTDMHVANATAESHCLALEAELANIRETNNQDNQTELITHFSKLEELSQLQVTHQDTDRTLRVQTTDSKITKLTDQITRAKHIEQVTKLTTKSMNLKIDVSKATVNPLVSARDKHAIDVEPIVPRLRNNRNAHLDYLRHLNESVETIRDIVKEAKVVRPLDRSIVSACRYTKHSQELLEYAIGTCPHGLQPRAKQLAHIPLIRKNQVIVAQPSNKHMSHVNPNRISPAKGDTKLPIDDKPRKNKSHLRTSTRTNSSSRLKRTVINSHSDSVFQTCAKCVTPSNHDLCVATCLQSAMATPSIHHNRSVERKVKQVWKPKHVRQVWKPTGKVLTTIGHPWRPTGQIFDLGNQEKEGYSDCDFKRSVHQANHPPSSEEAQVPPKEPREKSSGCLFLENVAKHRGILASETRSTQYLPAPRPAKPARKPQSTAQKAPTIPSISSPVTSTQPAPTSVPAKTQEHKCKQATGTTDKPAKAKRIKRSVSRNTRQSRGSPKSVGASEAGEVLAEEPQVAEEDADFQKAVEESMKEAYALPKGPLSPVVIREPDSRKYEPLPEVPGKGKAKVSEEQVAHDILSLQKHKKTNSEEESEKVVLGVEKGSQDEGQAGPDPNAQAEGQTGSDTGAQAEVQAGPDPGNAEAKVQSTSSPMVHAGSDREHMDIDVANVSLQPSTEHLYEGFT
nr:hypothetical protein [Tanacetum cinerariifolium]